MDSKNYDIEEKKAIEFMKQISSDLENHYIDSFLVNIYRTKKSIDILLHIIKEQETLLKYLTN